MMKNSTSMVFFTFLIMSTLMTISSNNWLGGWMGLEINLISFIPMMYMKKNYYTSECSMKYFIIQSMGSAILLFGMVMVYFKMNENMMMFGLMIKLGVAPFHMWMISLMESLNWLNCLILTTWQKIATLMLLSYLINYSSIYNVILSLVVGSIGGINQLSIKKMLAYSSINSMGWIMMTMMTSMKIWINYFLIYSMMITSLIMILMKMKINYLNQSLISINSPLTKMYMSTVMMSLGGLPPMMGFLPKLMVIQMMIITKNYLMIIIMVLTSLITMFYYMQICTTLLMLNSTKTKWIYFYNKNYKLLTMMSMLNMFGFIIIMIIKSM
uniref:NADH-ubiquinone oxidoreductase chain 2 n=1 Tax=Eoscarta assimilis TaxID=2815129 RepID=A0A8F6D5D4_9HEMI|nr:NADH dehydrogenase subunit 2 [Eoscarta assimilis]